MTPTVAYIQPTLTFIEALPDRVLGLAADGLDVLHVPSDASGFVAIVMVALLVFVAVRITQITMRK